MKIILLCVQYYNAEMPPAKQSVPDTCDVEENISQIMGIHHFISALHLFRHAEKRDGER